jgi:hypothetical protein
VTIQRSTGVATVGVTLGHAVTSAALALVRSELLWCDGGAVYDADATTGTTALLRPTPDGGLGCNAMASTLYEYWELELTNVWAYHSADDVRASRLRDERLVPEGTTIVGSSRTNKLLAWNEKTTKVTLIDLDTASRATLDAPFAGVRGLAETTVTTMAVLIGNELRFVDEVSGQPVAATPAITLPASGTYTGLVCN